MWKWLNVMVYSKCILYMLKKVLVKIGFSTHENVPEDQEIVSLLYQKYRQMYNENYVQTIILFN